MSIERAFDEARFGPERTLNLRAHLPTAEQAVVRAEAWLRERQMARVREVLVITGRGKGSEGGVSPVREAIVKLLTSLRRRNVVTGVREHTPGSFVVELASVTALFEAPKRRREPMAQYAPDPTTLTGLGAETRALLRQLATRALDALGAGHAADRFVRDEMLRQFAIVAAAIPAGGPDREARLQMAIRRAIEAYDDA